MEQLQSVLGILTLEATFIVLIFGWIFKLMKQLQTQVNQLSDELDAHKLHIKDQYFNKSDVLEMIGLVSAPIKISVDELKMDVVELKRENREDIKDLSNKIDLLIQTQGLTNRRHDDER